MKWVSRAAICCDSAGCAVRRMFAARDMLPVSTILTKLLSFLKSTLIVSALSRRNYGIAGSGAIPPRSGGARLSKGRDRRLRYGRSRP